MLFVSAHFTLHSNFLLFPLLYSALLNSLLSDHDDLPNSVLPNIDLSNRVLMNSVVPNMSPFCWKYYLHIRSQYLRFSSTYFHLCSQFFTPSIHSLFPSIKIIYPFVNSITPSVHGISISILIGICSHQITTFLLNFALRNGSNRYLNVTINLNRPWYSIC